MMFPLSSDPNALQEFLRSNNQVCLNVNFVLLKHVLHVLVIRSSVSNLVTEICVLKAVKLLIVTL